MTSRNIRIGDLITLVRRPVLIDPAADYRYIGVRSFGKGLVRYPATPGDRLSKLRYFELPENALVLSNIKAWEGAITVSAEGDSEYIASNRFLSYLPVSDDEIDTRYLSYFFLSHAGLPLIERTSPGAADRNRTLGIKAFEDLRIPLPDIDDQRRIAAWLDRLHRRRLEVSKHAKRAAVLFKALHNAVCRVNGSMETVGTILELVRNSVSIDPSATYRYIGIRSFGKGLIRYPSTRGDELSKLRYFELPPDALILSNIKAWEGAIAISTKSDSGHIASSRFLSYIPVDDDRLDLRYLLYFFLGKAGLPLIECVSPGAADRNRTLGIKAFEDLKIPLPDIAEQRRIGCLLDRAYEVVRRIEAREKLFDALIASALNQTFGGLG